MASATPCPPGSWLRGNICVGPDVCRISLVTSSPQRNAADLVVHAHGHRYALSRTGLAAATRRMIFGERVRLGTAAERGSGWWYVRVVERRRAVCAVVQWDVLAVRAIATTCAAQRCRCAVGAGAARASTTGQRDQSCRVCPAGNLFAVGLRPGMSTAQPHARGRYTACRYTRLLPRRRRHLPPVSASFYCKDETQHPCPDHRQTLQAGQSSGRRVNAARPDVDTRQIAAWCARPTLSANAGNTECVACQSHHVAPNGSVLLSSGLSTRPAAPATCAPCPARGTRVNGTAAARVSAARL